jgi:hypothetical protein
MASGSPWVGIRIRRRAWHLSTSLPCRHRLRASPLARKRSRKRLNLIMVPTSGPPTPKFSLLTLPAQPTVRHAPPPPGSDSNKDRKREVTPSQKARRGKSRLSQSTCLCSCLTRRVVFGQIPIVRKRDYKGTGPVPLGLIIDDIQIPRPNVGRQRVHCI